MSSPWPYLRMLDSAVAPGRGEMLIRRLPLAKFAICLFCVVVWVVVGVGVMVSVECRRQCRPYLWTTSVAMVIVLGGRSYVILM